MRRILLKLSIPLLAAVFLLPAGSKAAPLPHDYSTSYAVRQSDTRNNVEPFVERQKHRRKVMWRKEQISPSAHVLIRRVWANVKVEFPEVGHWGVFSCRSVRGGSSWSQHAYGRAIDLAPPTQAYGDKVVEFIRQKWGNRVYMIWRDGGLHESHIHVEVVPRATWHPGC